MALAAVEVAVALHNDPSMACPDLFSDQKDETYDLYDQNGYHSEEDDDVEQSQLMISFLSSFQVGFQCFLHQPQVVETIVVYGTSNFLEEVNQALLV